MGDRITRALDGEILAFMRRYASSRAPEEAFNALALKLFRYQFERNTHYRAFCRAAGQTPGGVRIWKEIPAMPSATFKEVTVTSFSPRQAVRVFRTSGTTAAARGAHYYDTLKLYEASILPMFTGYVLPDARGFSFFFLLASSRELPDSSLSYMMAFLNRRLARGRGRFFVLEEKLRTEALVKALGLEKRKVFIASTAFSLRHFIDWLREKRLKLRLPPGSRLMETGGFKGKAREVSKKKLYADCRRWLGIPEGLCISEYGMTELSSQFYDRTLKDRAGSGKQHFVKQGPAWCRTLVIDPGTGKEARPGQPGLLRHFDLANRGSVLAVQTEDLGCSRPGGFELVGRAPGALPRGCSLDYETLKVS